MPAPDRQTVDVPFGAGTVRLCRDDGAVVAVFVMPSCVSGRPAHRPDPVANDQDWALFWPMHLGCG